MVEQDPFVFIKSISNNGRGSTINRERKSRVEKIEHVTMLKQDPFVPIKSVLNNDRVTTISKDRKCRVKK